MRKEQVERLKRDPDFVTFMKMVMSERDRLNMVTDISPSISVQDTNTDVYARIHAIATIDRIFEPFIYEDVGDTPDRKREKYGLD